MLFRFALSTIAVLSLSLSALAETFKLDKEKSKIEFVGSKPPKDGKVESHTGGFKEFSSDFVFVPEKKEDGKFVIEIATASIHSDNPRLTDHLKQPDFFDVKKYPKIRFEATDYEKDKDDDAKGIIKGKLTLLDKTEEVTVPYKVEKNDSNLKIVADFKIDRTKWGMNYGIPNVNAEVAITASLVYKVKE